MIENSQIYKKRGNFSYKEKRLIGDIKAAIEEKNINMNNFNAASDYEELQKLHDKLTIESVTYTEMQPKKEAKPTFQETPEKNTTPVVDDLEEMNPLLRQNPNVRNYVLEDGLQKEGEERQVHVGGFDEPVTFSESFEIPTSGGGGEQEDSEGGDGYTAPKYEKPEPVNPAFDEMSNAKKKKQTQKMAKAIVHAVCFLAEKGSIWWVTKDITEDKLVEYELNNTIDLQILLSLEGDQQRTVRDYFAIQVANANNNLRIDEEGKEDMVESLTDVLLEKGIAPTPLQMVIISAVQTIVLGLGVRAFVMQQEIKGVLNQLIIMQHNKKKEETDKELDNILAEKEPSGSGDDNNNNNQDLARDE